METLQAELLGAQIICCIRFSVSWKFLALLYFYRDIWLLILCKTLHWTVLWWWIANFPSMSGEDVRKDEILKGFKLYPSFTSFLEFYATFAD